ncbi:MAG: RNA 2',3'-cyclic phosphodiesterase [bacterium]
MIKKMEYTRIFIAINFPPDIKLKLAGFISRMRGKFSNIRWVSDENLHLTLKFLGKTPESDLNKLYSGCQNAVTESVPFSFSCEGLGMFPSERSPRVVWLGIKKGEEELKSLVSKIENNLVNRGFPEEKRDYKPHLTLGRVKTEDNSFKNLWEDLTPCRNFKTGEIFTDKIYVMKSVLSSKGAEYSILKEFCLKKEGIKGN